MAVNSHPLFPVQCGYCNSSARSHYLALDIGAIVQCNDCKGYYVSPRVADEVILAKLQYWAKQDAVDECRIAEYFSEGMIEYHKEELEIISQYLPEKGKLLDIGCSLGAFLQTADRKGYEAFGIDLGKASIRYARNNLDLNVVEGSIELLPFEDESMDVITIYEVIEHLLSPQNSMREISRVLKPQGILAVSTPNLDSFTRISLGKGWWVINSPDEHIHLFTVKSLAAFMERAGFKVLSTRTRGISPYTIFKTLKGERINCTQICRGRRKLRNAPFPSIMGNCKQCIKRCLNAVFASSFSPVRNHGDQIFLYARKER